MKIINSDCIEAMKDMPDNSVDSIVTDPPYELSNDGKSSPDRVLFEVMFPKDRKLDAIANSECQLSFLVEKILGLSNSRTIPTPSPAMPISSVTLDDQIEGRNINVVNGKESSVGIPNDLTGFNIETQGAEYIGCFALELADFTHFSHIVSSVGAGFYASGIGVGFRVDSSSFPSLEGSGATVVLSNDDIRFRNNALANLASAYTGTSSTPVFGFDLTNGAIENFSADGARLFAAVLLATGAKFVRATSATGSLSSMLEARRVSVVDDATNGAFSFDLLIHTPNLASTGFMGKAWDGSKIAFNVDVWTQALRVLKPGGHLIAFSGSRTYHRMAVAIEDAGFEIRDQIMWIYGSGFPKSHNISKAMDKAAGAEREVIGKQPYTNQDIRNNAYDSKEAKERPRLEAFITAPATDEAKQWAGWGTALKPAHEPMVLARKPLIGTVATNVLAYGTGGLNIDASRVASDDGFEKAWDKPISTNISAPGGKYISEGKQHIVDISSNRPVGGRWPANVIHDGSDEVVELFPDAKGKIGMKILSDFTFTVGDKIEGAKFASQAGLGDSGSAARFFYCAKTSKRDRNEGLDGFEEVRTGAMNATAEGSMLTGAGNERTTTRANHHPTVKPTSLMQYLVRLVTPPNGTVLDPFMGSGSTGKACVYEGFDFIGIDMTPEYVEIAKARIAFAEQQMANKVEVVEDEEPSLF